MTVRVPAIPDIPLGKLSDDTLRAILLAIKQIIEIREGVLAAGTQSRFLTVKDLDNTGITTGTGNSLPNGMPK